MNPFVHSIALLHQQDLLEQARLDRRARLARQSQRDLPAWRRSLGTLLASAAQTLDPSVLVLHRPRRAPARGAGPLPAR